MIALLLWFSCQTLHAGERLEPHYLHLLLHAKTAARVQALRTDYENLQVARLACRIQLREETVPVACYQSLHLESQLGLYSPNKRRHLLNRLDQLCQRASAKLQVAAGPPMDVSPSCAHWMREALKIQDYRARPGT